MGKTFTSTYLDTLDYRLARGGVTLRRRVEKSRGLWQLKLRSDGVRLELELPGGPKGPPDELLRLLPAFVRGEQLVPVAKLRTIRQGLRCSENGTPVVDVTIDSVKVIVDGRISGSFRELEAQPLDGHAKALRRIEKAVRKAGARKSDGRPWVYQALNLPAPETPARLGPSAPTGEHLAVAFAEQYLAILSHDPGTRLGTDAEELHQMRVATRRFRAFLRAARSLLDPEWDESLRSELTWLGSVLGPVRDIDVLSEYLHEDEAGLDPRTLRSARRLFSQLEAERVEARAAMLEALESSRYFELLDRLEEAGGSPRLVEGQGPSLDTLAQKEFRRLQKAVKALEPDPADDALHRIRIRGKRARYTAELAAPTLPKRGATFIAAAKAFQDVLGAHQDAVFAEQRIRALLKRAGGTATAFAAGRLTEREQARRREARRAFPKAWARLDKAGRELWK